MLSIRPWRPCLWEVCNRPWNVKYLNLRAISSAASDYPNQSRGRLPRFFSETIPSTKGGVVRVQGDEFWHMTKVLRLKTNDSHLGTLKGGRADWLVEKCTELGASSLTPLLTERSFAISENRVDRLQRVILAAAKQSQRLHEMKLNHPMKIDGLLPLVAKSKQCFIATAEATPLITALTSVRDESSGDSGLIIVGPEGDFTDKEMIMIMEAGATAVGLGPHRLRVETATIALLATVMLWSDSQLMVNP